MHKVVNFNPKQYYNLDLKNPLSNPSDLLDQGPLKSIFQESIKLVMSVMTIYFLTDYAPVIL